ncbi:MAG: phosphatase PAP2 family protein [Prevotella sp.]|nr:phosphatase PAP2 family protein [Prevotella sp.]MBR1545788.1 phosphatase PAP2 family protein [Prevotella sp.]
MAMTANRQKQKSKIWAVEWVIIAYIAFTLLLMACWWDKQVNPVEMLWMRARILLWMSAFWLLYQWRPCKLTRLMRVTGLMMTLSWFYPDTYEVNRVLPNLDHLFAGWEQQLFGCQPSLLFSQVCPWGWFSELMCLGYVSYFPLMVTILLYYFFKRYEEFDMASFVLITSFFIYYTIFVILPVTGPQFYYLAVGMDKIAAGVFPNLTDYFLTHSERMAAPGWSDGFWYHMLDITHDAGERPTAAFPSSHVGVTTVIMLLACHTRSKTLIFTMLPFFILMCLSTVYIYAHYAIDAIAGLLTGILIYAVLRYRAKKMELR